MNAKAKLILKKQVYETGSCPARKGVE